MKTQQMTRLIKYCLHSLVVVILCITATITTAAQTTAGPREAEGPRLEDIAQPKAAADMVCNASTGECPEPPH